MLQELKGLDLDRIDIEDAVACSFFAKGLAEHFKGHKLPEPLWLQEKTAELNAYIGLKRKDILARERKALQTEADRLRTPQERREDISARLKAIDEQIAAG